MKKFVKFSKLQKLSKKQLNNVKGGLLLYGVKPPISENKIENELN